MAKKIQFMPVVYINQTQGKSYKHATEIPVEDWVRALGSVILAAAGLDALEFSDRVARLEELARQYDHLEIVED